MNSDFSDKSAAAGIQNIRVPYLKTTVWSVGLGATLTLAYPLLA